MSVHKRIWIERDPAYAKFRRDQTAKAVREAELEKFTYRVATRRRNRMSNRPYWCPLWANRLVRAAKDLDIDCRRVNDGMFFRSQAEREAVVKRAEVRWREEIARRNNRPIAR